ncbi:MAG: 23S rRNA (uracil(1939)-C(5))-methyltransferase RlmD [Acidobacteria bacterium]|nr:23S rRNA (uracil(1939)-C(5))-methyltransferase RlmD [Acidobacteriota bacterium]
MPFTIEKLIYGGDGLTHLPADTEGRSKAVFVPFVLPGEQVEAVLREQRPGFARAELRQVVQPSPRRIAPRCPYFQQCGGCHYQHAPYEQQLEIKAEILRENLRRLAKLELPVELHLHASPPWHYRNRSRLRVQTLPAFALGYYQFGSHRLLPVEECPISSPLINRAIAAVWQQGRAGSIPAALQEIEFFADADDGQLLIEISCGGEVKEPDVTRWAEEFRSAFQELAGITAFGPAREKAEPRLIATIGAGELLYRTGPVAYRVAAGAFFQTNRHLVDDLVRIVTQGRAGDLALDLYAGVGLFSTVLGQSFSQVIAVEPSPTSHACLRYNSLPNVKVVRATTEQYLQNAKIGRRPDLVVVDPPRSGLGEGVAKALLALRAERLTYVSCDPATLARDLKLLSGGGYRIEEAHLVDLFPQTYHLESVFHLVR